MDLKGRIRARARELGFRRVRFAAAPAPGEAPPGLAAYDRYLAEGRHGDMTWMERGRDARAAPERLLAGLRTVAVLVLDYGGAAPPDPGGRTGRVSRYAWGRDYHNLGGKRLRRLARELRADGIGATWSLDTRPVHERAWAERAGVGFVGRNGCIIEPGRGSWFFLATLFLDRAVDPDPPVAGMDRHCGSCTRCVEACPTGAITGPGEIDGRRCLAWLTIEHRGPHPPELARRAGRWVFGCDACQEVCPHNHGGGEPPHPDLLPRPGHAWPDLDDWLATPDEALEARFAGTPLRRPGGAGLKRNARTALANLARAAAGEDR